MNYWRAIVLTLRDFWEFAPALVIVAGLSALVTIATLAQILLKRRKHVYKYKG